MKTIGSFIKDARAKKRYSLAKLEEATKIKKDFIEAIEKEDWKTLPDYSVVVGFVKNIAAYLQAGERQAIALLRRDYPPQKLSINPKPDVSRQFVWSPKLTFFVGVGAVIAIIVGYLIFQYVRFINPPHLEVFEPKEGQVVNTAAIRVSGKTDGDAVIKANNQPILVSDDGKFSADIEIFAGTGEIVVKAVSRSGKETTVKRMIKPELK
ncbi:hypothetical protein A2V61_03640 [Candidatus Woesebacteria bacterium RBG_19FT_COMBO_47_8]|uniref:HTH cro/C1-type domain-containing protein n=1 Tax=Candidatus Woesebacteria bacterium RBG_13_46_13 TaxID=1802479 RepID=A0A1F7X585_9BACT|nr:MAG: hypothetical protein A2Y68_02240 [Candidatus Woesebacteria bacterium RBG_13_46_13]OGM16770.1 MAG: hypothetical protein A2V61_03640 [Candidatus Woesebacteria bacterium RBG_19FT_COMBO_47_8]HJX59181.1 helix-turn-helix domain-containing protein [Patescibacteria group bacterium]